MSLYNQLFDWQRKTLENIKDKKSYGLWLDMGLGKTVLGLSLAEIHDCNKIMIISINSKAIETKDVKYSWLWWANQMKLTYNFYDKKYKGDFETDSNDLLILNYESLFKRGKDTKTSCDLNDSIVAFIKSCKNQKVAILVDESHKMKDLSSKQTKAIMKIRRDLKVKTRDLYCYLLTGTPFTKGYEDLYSQLKFLGWDETKSKFVENFCRLGNIHGLLGWQQPIIGYKNIDALYDLIHKYAITIKSDLVAPLPEQIFENHVLDSNPDFQLFITEKEIGNIIAAKMKSKGLEVNPKYNTLRKINNPFYRNIAYPDFNWLAETNGQFYLRARELSIGFQGNAEEYIWYDYSRLKELEKFLENNPNNYVLFYNFTPELLEIFNICEKLNYNIDVYSGEIKSLKHYEAYSNLSESNKLIFDKRNIILANFASGSTGMNWQEYNQCIIFSLPDYGDYSQGIKRVHRLGQKNTVYYYIFYSNNFLDKGMRKALDEKVNYDQKMFDSDLDRVKKMQN